MSDTTYAPTQSAANEDSRTSAHGSFIWYELLTPDPVAAKTFYDAVVGWNIEPQPSGEMDYRMIGRADGGNAGGVMRLTDEMRSHGARPVWLGYVGVDDVDQSVAAIEKDGGKALMAAFDIPNVGRIALVTDPQGAPFYVMQPTPPAGDGNKVSDVFSVDQPQRVRWNELATPEPDGAIDFYRKQFGWSQDGDMDMGEMGKYRFIQDRGTNIGAVMTKPPQLPVSQWTYYIGVDDIGRAAEAIKSGGGQILNGPMEIPGGEFSLNALDPHGASFGLVGPRS
ncbi:VOC family protein [Sphingomonas sp.]|uniref:VOC family protein n=1 Tax=Sphingomonas sp. TaxID=28214 RepID=UPI00286C8F1D|nr:VOC family protein [Sphingomonas sp.]